ncbi:MBL fold metallo-hydrolase RNA specificity domain-containing protein [Kangiella sediminilitoris]|uniref:Beta-lactamase domain protein n=1 Tax=Kangiella sediminilitoris TaxID=1144748 RepID=A0A1B3BAQ1_9GAMM|nr:MBL fold metallo-hydrolase [Kangiella sediminilitoris]AOE49865.1 Beta-lactamase domain protein [Kangiella sediminilitoris]
MRISIHGAAEEVTGSCSEIETNNRRFVIDCGLIQGSWRNEKRNSDPFPFEPAEIDAVILTHGHIDHSGRLPLLVKSGYKGPIYCHEANRELLEILLIDSAYLQEKEAEWNNKKRLRKGLEEIEPLYTRQDVPSVLSQLEPIQYREMIQLDKDISFQLRNAGHILGSSHVEFTTHEQGQKKTVVFSGDIGNPGAPIQQDPDIDGQPDLVIMESTYGNRDHTSWDSSINELRDAIKHAAEDGGNVLIPAFAVGRTQTILHYFAKYYHDWGLEKWDIFLDSPMAIRVTEAYERYAHLYKKETQPFWSKGALKSYIPKLHFTADTQESMALNSIKSGAIIIAGSGMMTGGRIKHHMKHNLWRSQCDLIITGFQPEGTVGRRIIDKAPFIKLWGESVRVAASVHTIGGFSAHAGQTELLKWYQCFSNQPPVILNHGSKSTIKEFKEYLQKHTPADITIASRGQSFTL